MFPKLRCFLKILAGKWLFLIIKKQYSYSQLYRFFQFISILWIFYFLNILEIFQDLLKTSFHASIWIFSNYCRYWPLYLFTGYFLFFAVCIIEYRIQERGSSDECFTGRAYKIWYWTSQNEFMNTPKIRSVEKECPHNFLS